jgi:hypothetical protein
MAEGSPSSIGQGAAGMMGYLLNLQKRPSAVICINDIDHQRPDATLEMIKDIV